MNKIQLEMTLSMLEEDRKSLKKERDTYRDLCADLIEKMREIKMIVNGQLEVYYIASDAITKAASILGESQ